MLNHIDTSRVQFSGAEVNESYRFANTLLGGYSSEKVTPIMNHNHGSYTWTKPHGGVWLATLDSNGNDSWNNLINGDFEDDSEYVRTELKFTDLARVAVVNGRSGYLSLLDAYPFYPELYVNPLSTVKGWDTAGSGINADNTVRRNINFEKMSQDFDALFATRRGLEANGCDGDYFRSSLGTDVTLYMWDIESAIVFTSSVLQIVTK